MLLILSQCLILGSSDYIPKTAVSEITALACENSFMTLDCEQKNGIIRISRANYGRFSLGTCNKLGATNEWNVRCINRESKRIVAERYRTLYNHLIYMLIWNNFFYHCIFNCFVHCRCDGHSKCQVMASNLVFGDPCEGTYKYLQVYFTCQPIGEIELFLNIWINI